MKKLHSNAIDDSLSEGFAEILLMHNSHPACWYHINYVQGSDSNLSSYIGRNENEYYEILEALGLMKKTKAGIIWHKKPKWENLFKVHKLPDHYQITCAQDRRVSGTIRKLYWVSLGMTGKAKYTPLNQPKTVKKHSFEVLERKILLGEEADDASIASKVLFLAQAATRMREDEEMEKLAEKDDDVTERNQTEKGQEIARVIAETQEEEGGIDNENIIQIDPLKYPTLVKAKLVVNSTTLSSLLRDIIKVSEEFPDSFKLEYESVNSKRRKIMIIPQISTDNSFKTNAKPVLRDLPKNLVSDFRCKQRISREFGATEDSIRSDEEKEMVYRIVDHFCVSEQDTFVKVAQERGLNFQNKIMKAEMAAAMFGESSIGPGASRIVNRYLTAFFGRRIMPSEQNIFRGEFAHDELPPEVKVKQLQDKTKIRYYVKPLDTLISIAMRNELERKKKKIAS
jgi:hypothetical protein